MSERLFFFGDSHAGVYRRSAQQIARKDLLGGPLSSALRLHGDFFAVADDGGVEFFGQVGENFAAFSNKNGIEDLRECKRGLILSMGLAAAPFYWHRMWRGRYSFAPESRADRILLTRTAIGQMVDDLQRRTIDFYGYLFDHDLVHSVVAGPPPQKRHRILEYLPPEKILELCELYEAPVRAMLAERGVAVVAPADITDEDGFLREEYWGTDWCHGNREYGAKVIRALGV